MWHPAHDLDGRTSVILQRVGTRYVIKNSGRMIFDGDVLRFSDGPLIDESTYDSLQPVVAGNQIRPCNGFDFFVVVEDEPNSTDL